mmetsp:Transcript_12034/g.39584  ORF Transcript_12034/g.39584 Transcript_12034/m.39584 type:complete len:356 (-) Transcript_12034:898-1965(-)
MLSKRGGSANAAAAKKQKTHQQVSEAAIKGLFEQQKIYVNSFFASLPYAELSTLVEKFLSCRGSILFTGVGKSGFIARKINQTLVSTGTPAIWLAPVDALHGDIGLVGHGDIVVMLSKSGTTGELQTLLPYARAKGGYIVSVTADPTSALAKAADMHVTLPSTGELSAWQEASGESRSSPPVTYTALQMLFGDTLAVALMQARGLSKEAYAMNHPAGRIGKRLVLRVTDVMVKTTLPIVKPGEPGIQALVMLAGSSNCVLLVVDESNRLLGTFEDADLRRALTEKGKEVTNYSVMELMNFNKGFPRTCTEDQMAFDASLLLDNPTPVSFLPVLSADGKKTLQGMVTIQSLKEAGL